MVEKIKVLSLFSSGGLAETYLKNLNIEIIAANEIKEERAKFYSYLYPNTKMIVGDITNHKISKEIINYSKSKNVNCIIATPPCQGMSIAGNLNPLDKRNRLITYAIEIIKKIRPKFIMLENVPLQLTTKIKYKGKIIFIPEFIKAELNTMYNFNDEDLIKTMDYGIPQMRKRNIFLLVRKDMNFVASLGCIQLKMTPEEVINATTINTAYAMGVEKELGSVCVGKKANLFITKEIPSYSYLSYSFGENLINKIIINGKIIS